MSLTLKTIYSTLTGALGALAAWFVLDGLLELRPESVFADALLNGALVGLFIGAAVSGFAGLMEFKIYPFLRGLGVGLIAGLIGGAIGLLAGEVLYQITGGSVLMRIVGWATFGVSIGLADGALALSFRRALYAGIGGLLGGALGGGAFSLVARFLDLPNTSRSLGFCLLGAFIGLLVGLVPVMLSSAWIKVISSGRNEGKERLVDKKHLVIGAGERCDLPLYGDSQVNDKHAEIVQESGRFTIKPVGGALVLVNGQPIARKQLQNEDQFQVGAQRLIFRQKG
jgi:hypothetical protein